jgi:hypothetical protein
MPNRGVTAATAVVLAVQVASAVPRHPGVLP